MQQSGTVQLLHVPRHQVGAYRGLQHCGQVWACPICSAKISERRRQELGGGIETWQERGHKVLLVTYTIQHRAAHSLKSTLEGLLKARKGLLSGEAAKRFNRRHGVVGRVRALEVTHGRNGWHPHIHELIFVTGDTNRAELVTELRRKWAARIEASCGRTVSDYGVDVQFADMNVADYVAKFGYERTWGPEHELTKSASKTGKLKNRGPIGLLSDAFNGDEKSGRLWAEYALTFKGKRQLTWSDGLRELLGLSTEKTDEEVAEELREEAVWMDELSKPEWQCVLGNDARAELLLVLGRGSIAELREWLNTLGIVRNSRESEEQYGPNTTRVDSLFCVSDELGVQSDQDAEPGRVDEACLPRLYNLWTGCHEPQQAAQTHFNYTREQPIASASSEAREIEFHSGHSELPVRSLDEGSRDGPE